MGGVVAVWVGEGNGFEGMHLRDWVICSAGQRLVATD
jgi:hypothetical protein